MPSDSATQISVLIPVYNGAEYLETALSSLAAQTEPRFEAIISDDCSSDGSREIAEAWVGRDPRFRLRVNEANAGMTRNWNLALRDAKAEFVMKLDCDDAFAERALELLLAELTSNSDAAVAFCRTLDCNSALEPVEDYQGDKAFPHFGLDPCEPIKYCGRGLYPMLFTDYQPWHSNAMLHRRETLVAMGGWDERWNCGSDTDIILRYLERLAPVIHIPYQGVLYRLHEGSVSDQYIKEGWKLVESPLIYLHSLSRYADAASWSGLAPLRKHWWRMWQEVKRLVEDDALASAPPELRQSLTDSYVALRPPPAWIRCDGHLRQALRRLGGPSSQCDP